MDHNLEIRHCRVLVAVSDHGSVSAAARVLGLAQSTVSETLLSLERLIGAPVTLRRRGRESALTMAANTLLPHARALISASEAALATVTVNGAQVIRLGSVESASTFLLPGALATFRNQWPSVELKISIGLCDELRQRVHRGELDAAITVEGSYDGFVADDHRTHVLAPAQLCLFVSAEKQPGNLKITRRDLAHHPLLLPDPDSAFNSLMRNWFSTHNYQPRIESAGSIEGVKIGVRNSKYVGVLPSYAIARELATGEFVQLHVSESLPAIALGLTIHHQPAATSPLYNLIQHIERVVVARSDTERVRSTNRQ